MSNSSDDLRFKVVGEDAGASAVLEKVRQNMEKVGEKAKEFSTGFAGGLGFGAAFSVASSIEKVGEKVAEGIVEVGKASLEAFAEDERAMIRLDRVLKSTGNTTKLTAGEIREYAESLQSVSTFGHGVTIEAAGQLARFKNISGQMFKDTLVAAQDMSSILGTDLTGSVQLLGRVFQEPEDGLKKLKRAGVLLTDDKEKLIKYFTDIGDYASAQALVLKELRRQFEGAAQVETHTLSGQIAQTKNAIVDLEEAIGAKLAPTVKEFLEYVNHDLLGNERMSEVKAKLASERQITGTGEDRFDSYDQKIKELFSARNALNEDVKKQVSLIENGDFQSSSKNYFYDKDVKPLNEQIDRISREIEKLRREKDTTAPQILREQHQKEEAFAFAQIAKEREKEQKAAQEALEKANKEAQVAQDKHLKEMQRRWESFYHELSTTQEKNQQKLKDFDALKGSVSGKEFAEFRKRLLELFAAEEQKQLKDKKQTALEYVQTLYLKRLKEEGAATPAVNTTESRFLTRGPGNLNPIIRNNENRLLENAARIQETLEAQKHGIDDMNKFLSQIVDNGGMLKLKDTK